MGGFSHSQARSFALLRMTVTVGAHFIADANRAATPDDTRIARANLNRFQTLSRMTQGSR